MGLKAIIDGHVKEALGKNQDIFEQRMDICRECPLYKQTAVGPVCNSRLYLDTITGEISETKKPGYKSGCGCRLQAKTRLTYTHCPVGKW